MSQIPQIEIHTVKRVNLNGGALIDGFPSGGLTNSIASMCFMRSIRNELISILDSSLFPPLSMIFNGTANFPVRIYANEDIKAAFLISELNLNESLYYTVSKTILQWAMEKAGILELHSGSVSGIPALLLNEGMRRNFDVIVLLGNILKGSSEFRPASAISEAIMKIVPGLSCDIHFLLKRAEAIEQDLRKIREGQNNSTINLYR